MHTVYTQQDLYSSILLPPLKYGSIDCFVKIKTRHDISDPDANHIYYEHPLKRQFRLTKRKYQHLSYYMVYCTKTYSTFMWTANPLSHTNVLSVQHNIAIDTHDELSQDVSNRFYRQQPNRDSNLVDSASSIRLSQRLSHACLSINESIL